VTAGGAILRPTAEEAFAAYEALVLANREQVERLRADTPAPDFWAGRAARFRPGVLDAEELPALFEVARPDDVWLDIGAGGGRFAVPLSERIARLIAVEPSAGMREVLHESAQSAGRTNIEVVDLHWPPPPGVEAPSGDASLVANVLYNVPDLPEFLAAQEAHTRRLCAAIMSDRAPSTPSPVVWEALHGEPLCALPGLREFVAVLGALGRQYEVRAFTVKDSGPVSLDHAMEEQRWRFWTGEGTAKDARLRELLVEHFGLPDGQIQLPPRRNYTAVVTWVPTGEF
jgi:hypothetical protein